MWVEISTCVVVDKWYVQLCCCVSDFKVLVVISSKDMPSSESGAIGKNLIRSQQSLSTIQDDSRSDVENCFVKTANESVTESIILQRESLPAPVIAASSIFDCNPLALPPQKPRPIAETRVRKTEGMTVRDISVSCINKGVSIMASKDKILSIRRPGTSSSTISE